MLTVILGFSEDIEDEVAKTNIARAAEKASELTSRLVVLGSAPPRDATAEINGLLVQWKDILQSILGEDISFTLRLVDSPCYIRVSESEIQQVLVNVVTNAKEAMQAGGSCNISITERIADPARTDSVERECVISIADTGEGMDDETLRRIFDPYFSTKQGSYARGLGLSSVFAIVKRHNGDIQINTQIGQGTTIEIALPITEAPSDPQPIPPFVSRSSAKTVLVVEDEAGVRDLLCRALVKAGFEVASSEDGQAGLSFYEMAIVKPDIVITDVVMPKLRGTEFAKQMWQTHPEQPVIFMSGYPEEELAAIDFSNTRTSFLAKPFAIESVLNAIHEVQLTRPVATPEPR